MEFKVLRSFALFIFYKDKAKRWSKAGALQGDLTQYLWKRDGQNLTWFESLMPTLLSCYISRREIGFLFFITLSTLKNTRVGCLLYMITKQSKKAYSAATRRNFAVI